VTPITAAADVLTVWDADRVIVTAPREIDLAEREGFTRALTDAARVRPAYLVIDMGATVFCDASGVHAIMELLRNLESGDAAPVLVAPHPQVRKLFALTGVDLLIPVHSDISTALAAVGA
jgi:anti-anti-sigma factor